MPYTAEDITDTTELWIHDVDSASSATGVRADLRPGHWCMTHDATAGSVWANGPWATRDEAVLDIMWSEDPRSFVIEVAA